MAALRSLRCMVALQFFLVAVGVTWMHSPIDASKLEQTILPYGGCSNVECQYYKEHCGGDGCRARQSGTKTVRSGTKTAFCGPCGCSISSSTYSFVRAVSFLGIASTTWLSATWKGSIPKHWCDVDIFGESIYEMICLSDPQFNARVRPPTQQLMHYHVARAAGSGDLFSRASGSYSAVTPSATTSDRPGLTCAVGYVGAAAAVCVEDGGNLTHTGGVVALPQPLGLRLALIKTDDLELVEQHTSANAPDFDEAIAFRVFHNLVVGGGIVEEGTTASSGNFQPARLESSNRQTQEATRRRVQTTASTFETMLFMHSLTDPTDVGSGVQTFCSSGCQQSCPTGAHGPGWHLPGGTNDENAELRWDGVELNHNYFTVSMWVKRDNRNNDVGLFSYGEYPNHKGFMVQMRSGDYHIRASSDENPTFQSYDSGNVGWSDDLIVHNWAHVAIVKDGDAEIRFYINGQQVGNPDPNFDGKPWDMPANRHLNVGSWFESTKILKGWVSNVVVATSDADPTKAFSDAAVLSMYNYQVSLSCGVFPANATINAVDGCNGCVARGHAVFVTDEPTSYVLFPEGYFQGYAQEDPPWQAARQGYLRYEFQCSSSTNVSWAALQVAPDGSSDSFYIAVDHDVSTPTAATADPELIAQTWHTTPSTWNDPCGNLASQTFCRSPASPTFSVAAGPHDLFIFAREDGIAFSSFTFTAGSGTCAFVDQVACTAEADNFTYGGCAASLPPTAAGSVTDGLDGFEVLAGPRLISEFQIGDAQYAIVGASDDDGVQLIDISDPSVPVAVGSATDGVGGFDELDHVFGVTTFEIGSAMYAIVTSYFDDGVQLIDISNPAIPMAAGSATDGIGGFDELDGAHGVSTFVADSVLYAIVTGKEDDGVQLIDISDPSMPVAVGLATDGIGGFDELDGAHDVSTFVADSVLYAIVTAVEDDGVQLIDISDPSTPVAVGSATDGVGGFDELDQPCGVTTFVIDGVVYAIVAAFNDDSVQLIDISIPAVPVAVGSATDGIGGFDKLNGAVGVSVFETGSVTYAIVTAINDDGVQLIDISDPSTPVAVGSATDGIGGFDKLNGAVGVSTFAIGSAMYAIVTAINDDGVQLIHLTSDLFPCASGSGNSGFYAAANPSATTVGGLGLVTCTVAGYTGFPEASCEAEGGNFTYSGCIAQICPPGSTGTVPGSSGTGGQSNCTVDAGYSGGVVATTTSPSYTSMLVAESCPIGSNGTVPGTSGTGNSSGCVTSPGYSGTVTATTTNPFFTSTLAQCPPGQFSPGAGVPCVLCNNGWATDTLNVSGASLCEACLAGWYSPSSIVACMECGAGAVVNLVGLGATTCGPCPAGTYAAVPEDTCGGFATSCQSCVAGEYSPIGAISCTNCALQGLEDLDQDPATECEASPCTQVCGANFEDADCDASTACTLCGAGSFTVGGTYGSLSACAPCAAGMYEVDNQCHLCLAGSYKTTVGSGSCSSCVAGKFAPNAGGTSIAVCENCAIGQYAGLGSSSCAFCTAGTADTDTNASTACEACSIGTFAGCGSTECTPCAQGSVDADLNSATPCTECAAGFYWQNTSGSNAIASCVQCEAGKADTDSDSTTGCLECTAGEYCPAGAVVRVVCANISQADTDDDPTTPCEAAANTALAAQLTLDVSIDLIPLGSLARTEFEALFIADLAAALDVDLNRVQIQSIAAVETDRRRLQSTQGSVVVNFQLLPDTSGVAFPSVSLEAASANLVTLAGANATNLGEITTSILQCLQVCVTGFQDADCDDQTPCSSCGFGEYSAGGTSPSNMCVQCLAGKSDADRNATTECEDCGPGSYSGTHHSGPCTLCRAGKYAPTGGASSAVCMHCATGQYTDAGADTCTFCTPGTADTDSNASTPCSDCRNNTFAGCGATVCTECESGKVDADRDASTACTSCLPGEYWLNTSSAGGSDSECVRCAAGKADLDMVSTTDCDACGVGSYSALGSTSCTVCAVGQLDDDDNPSTPCTTADACAQECQPGQHDDDCDIGTPCANCQPGSHSSGGNGTFATGCVLCLEGFVDHDQDSTTVCNACRNDGSQRCEAKGMLVPDAAPGHYIAMNTYEESEFVAQCNPKAACLGGIGPGSCATGYTGQRCAVCLDRYYRSAVNEDGGGKGTCNACPSDAMPLWIIVVGCVTLVIVAGLAFSRLAKRVRRLSECAAPVMIALTFVQTVDLAIKVPLKWPDEIKATAAACSIFNFNVELAKPECSMKFDFNSKLTMALLLPVIVLGYVILISIVLVLVKTASHKLQKKKKRQRRGTSWGIVAAKRDLILQREPVQVLGIAINDWKTMGTHMFNLPDRIKLQIKELVSKAQQTLITATMCFSVFFLQTIMAGFDCPKNLNGRSYLDAQSEIECNVDDPKYKTIFIKSSVGLAIWVMIAMWTVHRLYHGGAAQFEFLSDKMQPEYYWWEVALLIRKLAVMMIVQSTSSAPLYGLFWCSLLISCAWMAHSHLRPYKEPMLNWCEDVSLFSTLFVLVAGVLFMNEGSCRIAIDNSNRTDAATIALDEETIEKFSGRLRIAGLCNADTLAAKTPFVFTLVMWTTVAVVLATPLFCIWVLRHLVYVQQIYKENTKLHVRGIGVHNWDGTKEGRGAFENEEALEKLFRVAGKVVVIAIRHRVDLEADPPQNTSWALVTFQNQAMAESALSRARYTGIFAGSQRLDVTHFDPALASSSEVEKTDAGGNSPSRLRRRQTLLGGISFPNSQEDERAVPETDLQALPGELCELFGSSERNQELCEALSREDLETLADLVARLPRQAKDLERGNRKLDSVRASTGIAVVQVEEERAVPETDLQALPGELCELFGSSERNQELCEALSREDLETPADLVARLPRQAKDLERGNRKLDSVRVGGPDMSIVSESSTVQLPQTKEADFPTDKVTEELFPPEEHEYKKQLDELAATVEVEQQQATPHVRSGELTQHHELEAMRKVLDQERSSAVEHNLRTTDTIATLSKQVQELQTELVIAHENVQTARASEAATSKELISEQLARKRGTEIIVNLELELESSREHSDHTAIESRITLQTKEMAAAEIEAMRAAHAHDIEFLQSEVERLGSHSVTQELQAQSHAQSQATLQAEITKLKTETLADTARIFELQRQLAIERENTTVLNSAAEVRSMAQEQKQQPTKDMAAELDALRYQTHTDQALIKTQAKTISQLETQANDVKIKALLRDQLQARATDKIDKLQQQLAETRGQLQEQAKAMSQTVAADRRKSQRFKKPGS